MNLQICKPSVVYGKLLTDMKSERGAGGEKCLEPGLVRGARNLAKTSGHGCDCQKGWGPVMLGARKASAVIVIKMCFH